MKGDGLPVTLTAVITKLPGKALPHVVRAVSDSAMVTMVASLVLFVACKPENTGIDHDATDGIWTGFASGSESADTTAGNPPQVIGCLDGTTPGSGLKHWCWGEYDLTVEYALAYSLGIPPPMPREVVLPPVSLANDSSYDDPFAMACCSDIEDAGWVAGDDTCELPHHRACHSDVIEHVCQVVRTVLAEDKQGLGVCEKDAVEGAITWLEQAGYGDTVNGEQQCYDFLWGLQESGNIDYCNDDISFPGMLWAPGKSFNGCLGSVNMSDLTVTISLHDIHPVALPENPQTCTGPDENDGLAPPVGSLPPGSVELVAQQHTRIDVTGPE